MTNDELKKKVVEIINDGIIPGAENFGVSESKMMENIADALIAAGLRFGENLTATFDHMALAREHELERRLGEAEHRVEVAERALNKFAENVTCEDCPFFSDCSSSEKMKDFIHSDYCFAEYLRQAEKELEEERKDD